MYNLDLFISLDLGTSNVKGAAFDVYGNEIAFESIEYNLYTPCNGFVENDIDTYWSKVLLILNNITKKLGKRKKNVRSISTCSQGETIVPVDKKIIPLCNAIVWIDTRSTAEAIEISNNFNLKEMYERTGYPLVDPSWPATKVLWLRKNKPNLFKKTYKFLLLEDYIIYKLSSEIIGEASVYNSSYYYDIKKFEYIDSMLDFIGAKRELFPNVVSPGTIIGKITQDIAALTGLSKSTKVVIGALDQVCGAVGVGNVIEGMVSETTGSTFAMIISTKEYFTNYNYKIPIVLHAVPDMYCLMPYSPTGGMVLKWFKDKFCAVESKFANHTGTSVFRIIDELALTVPAGSEGLLLLPFLTGTSFPEYNADARGVFFNFGINHEKRHFIRSILESLGYIMRNVLEEIKALNNVEKILSAGGGAASKVWSQIKADICGVKLEIPEYIETALLGSAILSMRALNFYNSLESACKNIIKTKDSFIPNIENKEVYDKCFKKYKNLYLCVEKLF